MRDERRSQILDAYEICIARFGVEGTTLDGVAEEAGLARPLIRHNVGNRRDLLDATVARFTAQSYSEMEALIAALPARRKVATMIDWLFDPGASDQHIVLVSGALVAAAANDAALAKAMRNWTTGFVERVASVVRSDHPEAPDEAVAAVAAGIASAYFSVESATPLGPMRAFREANKTAAKMLAATLEH